MSKHLCFTAFSSIALFLLCFSSWASAVAPAEINEARLVAQYNYSINILAMLLVGFGFLMVFVRRYGFSATTGTYLVVATGLPLYILLRANGIFGHALTPHSVDAVIYAEFAVATGLIAMGAVLGRLRVFQYALLALFIVPVYLLNEWLVLDNASGLTEGFQDSAGSIAIHAFGAYFGLGVSIVLTTAAQRAQPIESDATSDRFSMLGSMVLWLFWPSFATAIVPFEQMPQTIVNTLLALCGATLATYFLSALFHKGKASIVDMANAALAGGVAIGSVCNIVGPVGAFVIGLLGGAISVVGFVFIQPMLESKAKTIDTCGVHNLHGLPGLLGGFSAILIVPGIAVAQLTGIGITLALALIGGVIAGVLIRLTGTTKQAYEDSHEFVHLAGPEDEHKAERLVLEAKTEIQGLKNRIDAVALSAKSEG
ncbi:MAG TPA: ammonium transporter [Nitrosomonas europaea]|uniref:ammonium transporter n=1 Tax=Nitrosomonas europaea TaxID=915 RepID=UPI0024903D8C|nr:ammonium transporter [Nitrosomonas europaea]MDL1864822.1 ammonium transporter [Betaproteobacteria bacterium PRO5]HRO56598.1 ammonium transporter [Nitrosomonas europaea]HUM74210.1 ammonium transporter [Nitrosomonas europaea]